MQATTTDTRSHLRQPALRRASVMACLVGAGLLALGVFVQAAKADPGATIGGGATARVLPPSEKIRLLEDELAKETNRRVKAEEDAAKRLTENNALTAAAKTASKERAAIALRWVRGGLLHRDGFQLPQR